MATQTQDNEKRLASLIAKLEGDALTFDQFNQMADEALAIVATLREQLREVEEKINTYQEGINKK